MKKRLDTRKTVWYIIFLNILQFCAMTAMLVYTIVTRDAQIEVLEWAALIAVQLFTAVSAVMAIVTILPFFRLGDAWRSMSNTLDETEKLNLKLRAQRHDFLNQLQVVYSLMELEEYTEANAYIERVYDDIQKVSSILKTDHASLNAILQAKANMCQSRGIDVKMELSSRFGDIAIPVWQLCRILGNLIDNAVTALEESDRTDKRIVVTLGESVRGYSFTVANNGPPIPRSFWSRLFDPGFTTKQEEGHGMGLAICRELMEEYGGSLTFESTDESTSFTGLIPRGAVAESR